MNQNCQTHIQDIDMNRKGGVINFFDPSRGGVGNFLAPGEGGQKFLRGSSRKIAGPPQPVINEHSLSCVNAISVFSTKIRVKNT